MEVVQFFPISVVLPVHAQLFRVGTLATELEMEDYDNQSKPMLKIAVYKKNTMRKISSL